MIRYHVYPEIGMGVVGVKGATTGLHVFGQRKVHFSYAAPYCTGCCTAHTVGTGTSTELLWSIEYCTPAVVRQSSTAATQTRYVMATSWASR